MYSVKIMFFPEYNPRFSPKNIRVPCGRPLMEQPKHQGPLRETADGATKTSGSPAGDR